jgi:ankyrin repeat protein
VSLGANTRAVDNKNNTALHFSATNLNYPATKVLIDSNAPVDVKNNDVRMMSSYLILLEV